MYIDSIKLTNFRTFRESRIEFVHPKLDDIFSAIPTPQLPNVNLLLGNNGFGKTTLLKAIALAALGPAVTDSGIFPYLLIRREPLLQPSEAVIEANFFPNEQDDTFVSVVESHITVTRRGDLESLRWTHPEEKAWHPIFSSSSDAFFFVGYGATRRVEKADRVDMGSRKYNAFIRAQRIQSLFEESYSLIPLTSWLPDLQQSNPGRFKQVASLINKLVGHGHYNFTGKMEAREYLFERNGIKIPFPALSDGYRAFLGWVGDLLYHVCETCPRGKKLVENKGIVLVDEIDLHLHPEWQLTVLQTLSKTLPNIQFIVTSHSPLIVGSLEWMNIITMMPGEAGSSVAKRIEWAVHGLDADQVLLTDYFGLESTRAPGKKRTLKELTLKAREGDTKAAKQLLKEMSRGEERNVRITVRLPSEVVEKAVRKGTLETSVDIKEVIDR
ncbi:MAG TPA: AAA family ATPase [Desulfuromonadales bacterium]|nr:AAA family ATPase [Desulfuromonadales bacterium]